MRASLRHLLTHQIPASVSPAIDSRPGRRVIPSPQARAAHSLIPIMGLYDTVRCRYPLPHHQDAEFQTKDIECLLEGNSGMGGSLSEYEITQEGGVRLHVHEREWHHDPSAFLGGYAKSVRDWWEDVPDLHGDIRIYTNDENTGWVEFRVRFTNGVVQNVAEIQRDR